MAFARLFACAAIASLLAAAPATKVKKKSALECGRMTCRLFPSPAKAFALVLDQKPLVLAIGEAHQTNETVNVRSAISRFTESMLPLLKHRASDLVVETWVA